MSIEQFNQTGFTGNMRCRFQGKTYCIASVDFEENLIGIYEEIQGCDNLDEISWKRCENIDLI